MERPKIRPPQNRNTWSNWDKIWHSWLRQRDHPRCKISCNPSMGGFSANGWHICKQFYLYTYTCTFFSETHLQVRPLGGF